MPFLLPLISLVLAVVAQFAFREERPSPWKWDPARLVALLVAAAVAVVVGVKYGAKGDLGAAEDGFAIGILVTALLSGRPSGGALAPMGLGVAAAAGIHLLAMPNQAMAGFGLMLGAGLGALSLASEGATSAAIAASLVTMADYICARHSGNPAAPFLGSMVGIFALVGGLLVGWLGGRLSFLRGLVGALTITAGAAIFTQSIGEKYILTTIAIGAAAAVVIDWVLSEPDADAVRIALSAVIAIGVGTLAFGLAHGAGMALALVSAVGVLLAVTNRRAILALGPLAGLVFYRVLAEAHPASSRAFDIGQHYALIGLTLGMVLPLMPLVGLQRKGTKGAAGTAIWTFIPLGLPPLALLMFADRGLVALVVGLGFGSVLQVLRKADDLLPLAIAGAAAATSVFSLKWMTALADLNRSDKIHIFETASVALLVIAIALTILSIDRGADASSRFAKSDAQAV